jgi:hypothetical protein
MDQPAYSSTLIRPNTGRSPKASWRLDRRFAHHADHLLGTGRVQAWQRNGPGRQRSGPGVMSVLAAELSGQAQTEIRP